MRLRLPIAAAALLALAPLTFAGGGTKAKWEGFGEGSWVESKSTVKMSMAGKALPETVVEKRDTLVKVTDEAWTVRIEKKSGDAWAKVNETTIPRTLPIPPAGAMDAPKAEDLGVEKVTIDEVEFSCRKTKVTIGKMTTILWTNEAEGVLKSEIIGVATTTMLVTALAKKVKIGTKEVTCREEKTVSKTAGGDVTMIQLTSDEVPGRAVRSETTTTGPASRTTVTETTAFEAK